MSAKIEPQPLRPELEKLLDRITARLPLGTETAARDRVCREGCEGPVMYSNTNERLAVSFEVRRVEFADAETFDPRIVRVPPGHFTERHRHAHESLFIVRSGEGRVLTHNSWVSVGAGDIAFVPRWIFHQTHNTSETEDLVVLAITDFGLTRATLGDYDRRTRARLGGVDSFADTAENEREVTP